MSISQRILRFILPRRAFEAVRAGTKLWLAECPDGHRRDVWDLGGVRYKAAGEPRTLAFCPDCGRNRWLRIRRKTETEKREFP